jgi:16S rRNA A1518/A1519 N6-dimethyltransferase RsmA/KsgA/DIM1 with predicted DNA glycosylase/AP lyase activity
MAIVEDPEDHELAALDAVAVSFASRRVLEIGCGDGRLTKRYAADAASVVAIDPDADAIAELRRELPGVDARAIGVEELDLADHSVDVVLFAWSL